MRYISPQARAPRPAGEGKVSEPVDLRSPVSGAPWDVFLSFDYPASVYRGTVIYCQCVHACTRRGSKQETSID
jgi:hypothetical protein